jgi:PAS domain S-box-containing protein
MTDWQNTPAKQGTAILAIGEDGRIIGANAAASGLLGVDGSEVVGSHLSSFLTPEADAGALLEGLKAGHSAGSVRVNMVPGRGESFSATLSSLALPCTCGNQAKVICAIHRTVPARAPGDGPSDGRVPSVGLADLLPEIVFEMDLSGMLTFVNRKAYEITGYTPEDFERGLNALDILHPEDREGAQRNILAIMTGSGTGPHEYTALRKDGTGFPVLIHSVPVLRNGRPAGLRGVMIDMTERRRTETDLRIVDIAMASSINGIAIADMEGRLTYVNAAFLRMWGYESEREVMQRPALEFWHKAERAKEVVYALQRQGGWIGELVGMRKDGTTFEVEAAATLVTDDEGRPIRMMASFIDITDRKRAEHERQRELIRREKLHGALEMAGATCHEFNQPMQVISGYTELLLRDIRDSGPGYEELKRIKAASDRMIEITRKLQQITRYRTREYVGGATIIDIDKSSCLTAPEDPPE